MEYLESLVVLPLSQILLFFSQYFRATNRRSGDKIPYNFTAKHIELIGSQLKITVQEQEQEQDPLGPGKVVLKNVVFQFFIHLFFVLLLLLLFLLAFLIVHISISSLFFD